MSLLSKLAKEIQMRPRISLLVFLATALAVTFTFADTKTFSANPGDTIVINVAPAPSNGGGGSGGNGGGSSGNGGSGGVTIPGNAIELPYRSDIPRTNAPGNATFWFHTPASPSSRGATNITIVANHPAGSKLVLSLTPGDFDHPIGDPMAQAVSYGDSGETRSIAFFVGRTVPYVVSLPLDTVIYANFRYTGELDGGAIEAYLSNAQ